MPMFGWTNDSNIIPFFIGAVEDEPIGKIQHDSYEVYVNGDFVGKKTLISQAEKITDIDKHLQLAEFKGFKEETIGNHVNIKTNDIEEAEKIKLNLKVYLNAR